jgi:hypothetical protein
MASRSIIREITFGHEKPAVDLSGYLFDKLLPKVGLWFVVGAPGCCKSLLSIYAATCLAAPRRLVAFSPEEVIDTPVTRPL